MELLGKVGTIRYAIEVADARNELSLWHTEAFQMYGDDIYQNIYHT